MNPWVHEMLRDPELARYAPQRPPGAAQIERDILLLHYEMDPAAIRPLVPAPLELHLYGGSAWVGILALQMADVQVRLLPWIPGAMRNFPEVDFATYVRFRGRDGLFFLSLESGSRWVAPLTRLGTGLPWMYSGLRRTESDGTFSVQSGPRSSRGAGAASLDLSFRPDPAKKVPDPGSPIALLSGQYSAFNVDLFGRICEVDEIHDPFETTEVDCEIRSNSLGNPVGLRLPDTPALMHYTAGRRIVSWFPRAVTRRRSGLAPTNDHT